MSVEVACQCDEAFGLPHSHVYVREFVRMAGLPSSWGGAG
jgi:hypothetical protein